MKKYDAILSIGNTKKIASALLISLSTYGFCQTSDIYEKRIINQLNKIISRLEVNNTPWPDFNILQYPIIATFKNQHNYAYFFTPQDQDWLKISNQPITWFLKNDKYKIDDLAWSFGNIVDGQTAFIANLDLLSNGGIKEYDFEILHTIFHERFHIFQLKNFSPDLFNWNKYDYEGFNNTNAVKLTYLEDALLINYLKSHDIEILKNYVAVSQYREKILGQNAFHYETAKEDIEGVADYYGARAVSENMNTRSEAIIKIYAPQAQGDNIINWQIHNRYYFTGNATGIALDQIAGNSWKKSLVTDKIPIRNQLFSYFPMNETEIEQRINQSKIKFNYEELTNSVEDKLNQYISERDREFKNFNKMDGVVLNLEPTSCNLFGMVGSKKRYFFNSNTEFFKDLNGDASCSDKSIRVHYIQTPYVFDHNGEKQIKINPDTIIQIDDYIDTAAKLLNANNSEYNFSNFSLKANGLDIKISNRPGKLRVDNGEIKLITRIDFPAIYPNQIGAKFQFNG